MITELKELEVIAVVVDPPVKKTPSTSYLANAMGAGAGFEPAAPDNKTGMLTSTLSRDINHATKHVGEIKGQSQAVACGWPLPTDYGLCLQRQGPGSISALSRGSAKISTLRQAVP